MSMQHCDKCNQLIDTDYNAEHFIYGCDEDKTLINQTRFIESQFPNYPMWKKFEMIDGDFTDEEKREAFNIIWQEDEK